MSKARTRQKSDVTLENIKITREALVGGLDVEKYFADATVWKIPRFGFYEGKTEISVKLPGPMHGLMERMGSSVVSNIVGQGDMLWLNPMLKIE